MFASRTNTLPEMFRARVVQSDTSECYRTKSEDGWSSTSWREFSDTVDSMAAALIALGINK